MQVGYPCLSLHGAKDQSDRESTINDFKTGVSNVLVATSIAARGLDVKDLVLVVNYEVPNHHEDYVHRVGRTGMRICRTSHMVPVTYDVDHTLMCSLSVPTELEFGCTAYMSQRQSIKVPASVSCHDSARLIAALGCVINSVE